MSIRESGPTPSIDPVDLFFIGRAGGPMGDNAGEASDIGASQRSALYYEAKAVAQLARQRNRGHTFQAPYMDGADGQNMVHRTARVSCAGR